MLNLNLRSVLKGKPSAFSEIFGSPDFPNIKGYVRFYQTQFGTVVAAEVSGLPAPEWQCQSPIFGFHIHSGARCRGNKNDPFADALTHYDPHGCPHPFHSGDMPPLFGSGGNAFLLFLTDRFTVAEIIGKTVVIHSNPDDFKTQPSGNAGTKIACGEIKEK